MYKRRKESLGCARSSCVQHSSHRRNAPAATQFARLLAAEPRAVRLTPAEHSVFELCTLPVHAREMMRRREKYWVFPTVRVLVRLDFVEIFKECNTFCEGERVGLLASHPNGGHPDT